MKILLSILSIQLIACLVFPISALAKRFEHIVLITQENRTPDNLFQGLCANANACGVPPLANQYDILTSNWLNKNSKTGVTQPFAVALANDKYDPGHDHESFDLMCDPAPPTGACKMDGAADEGCSGDCPNNFAFAYVPSTSRVLDPYLALATQYGWANYMFQTRQGPSFPAHQFLFGATAAPSSTDDQNGTFAAENGSGDMNDIGCATSGTDVQLIDANGLEKSGNTVFPCFEHATISDSISQQGFTWRYYTPSQNSSSSFVVMAAQTTVPPA